MSGITRMNLDEGFANGCAYSEVVAAGGAHSGKRGQGGRADDGSMEYPCDGEGIHGKYPARKTISTEFAHRGGEAGLQV